MFSHGRSQWCLCSTSTADIIVEFNIPPLTPTASDLTGLRHQSRTLQLLRKPETIGMKEVTQLLEERSIGPFKCWEQYLCYEVNQKTIFALCW
jgi:hypothetical protein